MNLDRTTDAAIDAFLADGITDLPDRAFDAVRADIHRTRQRVVIGPWKEPDMLTPIRFAVAAAIVVVAIGFAWNQVAPRVLTGGPASPGASQAAPTAPAPTPAAVLPISGTAHELAPGRYSVDYGHVPGARTNGPTISFDLPVGGWRNIENFGIETILPPEAQAPGASLAFWNITNLPVDPCTAHEPRTAAPGPSVADLMQALGGQRGIRSGPVTDVTLDGYVGQYVDLTVITAVTDCPDGFVTWASEAEARRAALIDEVDRVYALDVDGQRVTFFTRQLADTEQLGMRQINRMLDSIDIRP